MDKYENALKKGILLSVFSIEELMEKYKESIYYDAEHLESNIYQLCLIDSCMENILRAREKQPLNDGVGCLYLHEVYEKLGLKYDGDRNIGITTKPGDTWHNLYSPWISVKDRLPEKDGCAYLVTIYDPYYEIVSVTKLKFKDKNWWTNDGDLYNEMYPVDEITYWMPLPEPPRIIF